MENIITPDKNLRPCKDEQRKLLPKDYFRWSEKLLPILKNSPDFVARIDAVTGETETFGSIADKSIRCAIWLKKQGIQPGDTIGYCSNNHLDSCIPLFASFYIGTIINAWCNQILNEDLVKFFVKLTEPKVVFIDEKSAKIILKSIPNITDKIKLIIFGKMEGIESFDNILKDATSKDVNDFKTLKIENPEMPLAIVYSSGTSGEPKGVLHTYGSLRMINTDDGQKKVNMWFTSVCWITGFVSTINSVFSKSTAIIHNTTDTDESLKIAEKYKVTKIIMGAGFANRILYKNRNIHNYDLSSVREIFFGGSYMSNHAQNYMIKLFPNASIHSVYASTECFPVTGGEINPNKLGSSGKVIQGTMLKVIDLKTKEILGPNKKGEVCVIGMNMMVQYWKNQEKTEKAIDSEGWYHTGDLGYYDEDGYIWIIDRLSLLINYKNYNVPATIIEGVIRSHDSVADVGVVQKNHDEDIGHVTAFVAKCPGTDITEQEIIELVEEELPEEMWLRGGVYFLDKIPYTPGGKMIKAELYLIANK
ncbi:4-coumarate--CoA ligase 1-like isoform X3 [Aphidius gifuensis]|uniref:4-coumarate--CoA ligase 1-like isoform X3 n=1 Tax=Aphidius gifuensis TaxID=684658 RepID=UPI001CDCCA37|nr:4-coumarate--CoA ligase 1-like isoform X3 [Aphidius gifuensis]